MLFRPNMYTSYESDSSLLPTGAQKTALFLLLLIAVLLPFDMPVINQLPIVRFLGDPDWIRVLIQAVIFATAALGLNLLSGVAGQVSLGHAFFLGVGASTAVLLGGEAGTNTWGWGLPIWIWLPASGVVAAIVGVIVSPAAVRVRGLYLAIVTVGLTFIGIHLSRIFPEISGGAEVGRNYPALEFRWWKEETPFIDFDSDGVWFGVHLSGTAKTYLLCLGILIVATIVSKNIIRSRTGRAFQSIRDRDVAAEVMGVAEFRYKMTAFAASSFFAGVGGALFASFIGKINPEYWDILLSVEFIAIILIGGAGTTSGTIMGALFVVMSPKVVETIVNWMGDKTEEGGFLGNVFEGVIQSGQGDAGLVSVSSIAPGFALPANLLDAVLYGALIIGFLLFEPLGLFGLWHRIKNYWKQWPFSY